MRTSGLEGRVAIVTGAAQGVGKCIADFLARDGVRVIAADIQGEKVREVARELSASGQEVESVVVDIADPLSAERMVAATVERFGHVDILVNNAGIDAPPGFATELTKEDWQQVVDVDLSGAWWCTKAVLPHMLASRWGRIIFISSMSWRIGSRDISVAYNTAKAGLIGLTIGLSVQLEEYGILVNAITPGPTGTGRGLVTSPQNVATRRASPLGIGGPEPIAHACLYLVGESGDWISGSVLNVSGGWLRG
ncbi:MAG: SDR family NAD(P)-dependent oxidoreductase [Actinomycetota bacterium]